MKLTCSYRSRWRCRRRGTVCQRGGLCQGTLELMKRINVRHGQLEYNQAIMLQQLPTGGPTVGSCKGWSISVRMQAEFGEWLTTINRIHNLSHPSGQSCMQVSRTDPSRLSSEFLGCTTGSRFFSDEGMMWELLCDAL